MNDNIALLNPVVGVQNHSLILGGGWGRETNIHVLCLTYIGRPTCVYDIIFEYILPF